MAKEKQQTKENGILSIFTKEYKYEGLLLLFLSLVAILLGTMVIMGENSATGLPLTINKEVFLIGEYPKVFAWILIILGAMSLILAVWPFLRPSVAELKRVSWPKKGELIQNTATVFAFIVIVAAFFLLSDYLLGFLLRFFEWLAGKMPL